MRDGLPPKLRVAVDVVAFALRDQRITVLLIRRGSEKFRTDPVSWALPGAFLWPDETLEECAIRVLAHEAGAPTRTLRQFRAYGDPDRDPRQRVVSIAFLGLVQPFEAKSGAHTSDASWWPLGDIPQLAFDHVSILTDALFELRRLIEHTAIAVDLLPDEFTLSELQEIHESILETQIDKRNFRRSVLQAGMVVPTGRFRTAGGRPAQLFKRGAWVS